MPAGGLEPPRPFGLRILSPLRLPFRQAGTDGVAHAGRPTPREPYLRPRVEAKLPHAPRRVSREGSARGRARYVPSRTMRRQCSSAASIRLSLASGVRKAACGASVALGSRVSGWPAGSGSCP